LDGAESRSRRLFSEIGGRPDEAVDLAEACLLFSCEEYPDLDVRGYLARLDGMASTLRERSGGTSDPELLLAALKEYLFGEEGFHGNNKDYYDPKNSFLTDVLDRRTGIPITLSIVYMEVARRVGLPAYGVGLPGHFIVKVALPGGEKLVDPFYRGEVLSLRDCQARLDRIHGGRVKVEEGLLSAWTRKNILSRTLRNLKHIYMKEGDFSRALGIVDLLMRVNPSSGVELRDRGMLYAALDCYQLAADDLEKYLSLFPGGPEAQELLDKIVVMRHKIARLN
jgi:regulator of sirC expression with transglutaminase-like and TPR domain